MKNVIKAKFIFSIFILSFLAYIVIFSKSTFDFDMLWHIKNGKSIIMNNSISFVNNDTWLDNSFWNQQEWLFDVLIYTIVKFADLSGYMMMFSISQIILITLAYQFNKKYITSPLIFYALLITFLFAFPSPAMNRPIYYSSFVMILIMYLYKKEFSLIYSVVFFLLGVFIANFHAGMYLTCTALIILMFISETILMYMINNCRTDIKTKLIKFFIVLISFLIGILCNPLGINLIFEMLRVPFMDTTSFIQEWNAFSFSSIPICIIIVTVILSFGYALKSNKNNPRVIGDIMIMCAFLCLSFLSAKSFTVFTYLYLIYGFRYILMFFNDFLNLKENSGLILQNKCIIIISLIVGLSFSLTEYIYTNKTFQNLTDSIYNNTISPEMQTYLTQHNNEKLLNSYNNGNILMYNDIKVFLDTRQHPYVKETGRCHSFDDFLVLYNSKDKDKLDQIFAEYNFDAVISDTNDLDIEWYLSQKSSYHCLYTFTRNDNSVVKLWVTTPSPEIKQ